MKEIDDTEAADVIMLSINCDPESYDEIDAFCKRKRISKAEMVRRAFRIYQAFDDETKSGAKIYLEYPDGRRNLVTILA